MCVCARARTNNYLGDVGVGVQTKSTLGGTVSLRTTFGRRVSDADDAPVDDGKPVRRLAMLGRRRRTRNVDGHVVGDGRRRAANEDLPFLAVHDAICSRTYH